MPLPLAAALGAARAGQAAAAALGLGGKRQKSSCRMVADADLAAFRAGTAAPWVVQERIADVAAAFGLAPEELNARTGLTFADCADLHVSTFIPLCQAAEGGRTTDDPNSGEGLALYNSVRAQFVAKLRDKIFAESAGLGGTVHLAGKTIQVPASTLAQGERRPSSAGAPVPASSNRVLVVAGIAAGALLLFALLKGR